MQLERALESLRAAELCLGAELVDSAVSRAYYAMFQAAQVALEAQGVGFRQRSVIICRGHSVRDKPPTMAKRAST